MNKEEKEYWRQVWCLAFNSRIEAGQNVEVSGRVATERAELALRELRKNGGAPV